MDIVIPIEDDSISGFTEGALEELKNRAKENVQDLVRECCLVEKGRRSKDQKKEVTQIDVSFAAQRPKYYHAKRKWWQILVQSMTPIITLIIGQTWDTPNKALFNFCIIALVALAVVLAASIIVDQL